MDYSKREPDRSAPRMSSASRAVAITLPTVGVVVLAALSSPEGLASTITSWWPVLCVLLLQGAVLVWVARAPASVLALVAALPLSIAFFDLANISTVTTVPIMAAVYLAGTRSTGPRLRRGVFVAAFALMSTTAIGLLWVVSWATVVLSSIAMLLVVMGVPLLIASIIVAHRRTAQALRAEKAALERMQQALLDAAIAEERAGIARELHDVAAHHMSGIALMSAGIERQVRTDPDAALEGLKQVRKQTRMVLDDLRQAVGLLRGGEGHSAQPHRIDAVRDLIATKAVGENPIDFHVKVRPGNLTLGEGLGPLAHLAGYRMVQESLANTIRHAPGAQREVLIDDADPALVTITVTNGPPLKEIQPAISSGLGIRGMLERAELVKGMLEYGRTAEGGWRVALQLPRMERSVENGTVS